MGRPPPSRVVLLLGVAATGLSAASCSGPSTLVPRGPQAAVVERLWWVMLAVSAAVFVVVMALLLMGLRNGEGRLRPVRDRWGGHGLIVYGGLVGPTVILFGLFGLVLHDLRVTSTPPSPPELVVEVVGWQWWWEVRYPELGVTTANEIHVPVGRPVELRVLGADVIHSFWVPQLGAKIDTIPGRENVTWFMADEPGVYQGICAEFCGLQHANMLFEVVAEPEQEFRAWAEREAGPAAEPETDLEAQGLDVLVGSPCAACHTIRGTPADGELGPDLTHLASRRTIGAGILRNNVGNLGGWVIDPQPLKPGVKMPPAELSGPQVQALLAYLTSLE